MATDWKFRCHCSTNRHDLSVFYPSMKRLADRVARVGILSPWDLTAFSINAGLDAFIHKIGTVVLTKISWSTCVLMTHCYHGSFSRRDKTPMETDMVSYAVLTDILTVF